MISWTPAPQFKNNPPTGRELATFRFEDGLSFTWIATPDAKLHCVVRNRACPGRSDTSTADALAALIALSMTDASHLKLTLRNETYLARHLVECAPLTDAMH